MSRFPDSSVVDPQSAGGVFVLDDDAEIGALICKVSDLCGLACRQFTSPAQFLEHVRISAPALIVLDLSLGQSDAVEVIRHLEANRYQGKVLLISGRDETTLNEIKEIGERHGLAMLAPLKKPFRALDIKTRLSGQMPGGKPQAGRATLGEAGGTIEKISVSLAEALHNDWLEVWYQPKIDLKSLSICGAEALTRVRHPLYGVLAPASFLPPAGDPSYGPLTEFVGRTAMADWRRFAEQGAVLKLSINAPMSVIEAPAFIAKLRCLLPSDPRFPGLTVEVTEDEVIRDRAGAREVASQLKLYNIDLSIDDFGSGYASLSRLNDLPVAEVKIDRSFVFGCAANKLKHSLCQTVVDLAHRCGATACAEGVETLDDAHSLIAMGCDLAQGFLFAKPMPAADFAAMLAGGTAAALPDKRVARSGKNRRLAQNA